jgi:hypothetical protein
LSKTFLRAKKGFKNMRSFIPDETYPYIYGKRKEGIIQRHFQNEALPTLPGCQLQHCSLQIALLAVVLVSYANYLFVFLYCFPND